MRRVRDFLESAVEAIEPYGRMAERDVEMLIENISENIPGKVKVYALTWWGVYLVHILAIIHLLFSSWVIALICGKGTLPAAWFTVNFIIFVMVYNIVFLCRWDDEGWQICPVCGEANPEVNFCDQCGTLLRPEKFPWLVEQK
jgi:hypothetical protein